jgi:hypothetical protein
MRIRAALQPVNQNDRGRVSALWLPVAESEELRVWFGSEEALDLRDPFQGSISWPVPWREGHEMRVTEEKGRSKRRCGVHAQSIISNIGVMCSKNLLVCRDDLQGLGAEFSEIPRYTLVSPFHPYRRFLVIRLM